jgi:hypothetical protein
LHLLVSALGLCDEVDTFFVTLNFFKRGEKLLLSRGFNHALIVIIVRLAKRMRDAGHHPGVTPLRSIHVRERAYKFSTHFRVERGARTVL